MVARRQPCPFPWRYRLGRHPQAAGLGPTGAPNDAANRKVELAPSTTFEATYTGNRFAPDAHEFGHALGMPDEYDNHTTGLLGDKQAVPDLIEMLSSAASLSAQAAISTSLGTIGDSRSVHALLELLSNARETELARAFGAVALGIVADKEALPWNAKIGVGSNYRANTSSLTDGKGGILDIL